MAKNIKKLFALILAVAMVMSLSVTAFAAEGNITLDKTADWSDEKYVADVTLSVGGDAEDLSSDIVFLMGNGPAGDVSYIVSLVKKMMVATDGTDTKIKLGIVTFADNTANETVMPLTEMKEIDETNTDPEDMDCVIAAALQKAIEQNVANGVNLHSAMETAREMLEADDDVPAERKHLIVITTGLGYFFDTEDGQAATIVNTDSNGDPCWSNLTWLAVRNNIGNTDSGYPIPFGMDWDEYWDMVCDLVEADGDDYTYVLNKPYSEFYSANKAYNKNIRFGYQITNAEDRAAAMEVKVPYFPKKTNPLTVLGEDATEQQRQNVANASHAMSYERGQWEAWNTAEEMREDGMNVYPILNAKALWMQENQISRGFMDMLAGGDCPIYGEDDFFAPIENQIMYSVGAGSYVEDYMGYGDEYDFDFIDEIENITLKVGQVEYTTTKLETANEGYDSSYAFTAPEAEEPTFWLDYVKGNGTSEEMFKWTYGENVSNFAPVVLDYQVRLVTSPAVLVDDLVCETNKVAILYPDGGDPEEFPVPEVTLEPVTYTVTYIDRDVEVQFTDDLVTGDEIPGCEDPENYETSTAKYTFKKWKLIEGKEGKDGTVGETDLVYESVYTKKSKQKITPNNPDIEIPDDEIPLAEIPELFGDDHFAYIIGRDDGLVHPEANITRAEVATIFFRLLAEEVRAALMTGENNFSDVDEGQWYNHAVSTLSSIGVIFGKGDGSYFDPDAFITRAEFAAIAARFDPAGNPEGVFFTDISGHWAEREIIIAANNGWVEGYNGLFRPDDYITRAEAMTLVNRVLHRLPEFETDLLEYMVTWPDNMDVNAWYYLAVQEATNSHFYERKENPVYETWTEFREPYDWSLLEY